MPWDGSAGLTFVKFPELAKISVLGKQVNNSPERNCLMLGLNDTAHFPFKKYKPTFITFLLSFLLK